MSQTNPPTKLEAFIGAFAVGLAVYGFSANALLFGAGLYFLTTKRD